MMVLVLVHEWLSQRLRLFPIKLLYNLEVSILYDPLRNELLARERQSEIWMMATSMKEPFICMMMFARLAFHCLTTTSVSLSTTICPVNQRPKRQFWPRGRKENSYDNYPKVRPSWRNDGDYRWSHILFPPFPINHFPWPFLENLYHLPLLLQYQL